MYDTGSPGKGLPKPLSELLAWLLEVEDVFLAPNPSYEPPEAIVEQGVAAITNYFQDLFADGFRVERRDVKAVIVGQEGAGKTR